MYFPILSSFRDASMKYRVQVVLLKLVDFMLHLKFKNIHYSPGIMPKKIPNS